MAIVEEQFVSGGRDPGFGSQPSLGGQLCCALTLALAEGPVADQSKEVRAWGEWVHLLPPSEEDGEHGRAAQGRPNTVLPPGFKDQNLQCEAERVCTPSTEPLSPGGWVLLGQSFSGALLCQYPLCTYST